MEQHVLGDGEVLDQKVILVDRLDSQADGFGRAQAPAFRAAHYDPALVGRERSGDDLHEGGLAGAILAHEPVYFAAYQLEVHSVQREHAGIALGQASRLEDRVRVHGLPSQGWAEFSLRAGLRGGYWKMQTPRFGPGRSSLGAKLPPGFATLGCGTTTARGGNMSTAQPCRNYSDRRRTRIDNCI